MINFEHIFINPFQDLKIHLTRLLNYAAIHQSRLIANNPGALFNARITATATAISALEGLVTNDGAKLALQKARTLGKQNFREALPVNILRIHAAVVVAFGEHSEAMMEIFPEGRGIFGSCKDEQLNNKIEQLVANLIPHVAAVGQAHVSNAEGLHSTWIALYAAQTMAKGAKSSTRATLETARAALALELFRNLLTLALQFPDQPEKVALYCPQHLLLTHPPAQEPGITTLSAGAFDANALSVTLTLEAEGAHSFTLERRLLGETAFTLISKDIAATDGDASYVDTVPAFGNYEYVAHAVNSAGAGAPSSPVLVNAA